MTEALYFYLSLALLVLLSSGLDGYGFRHALAMALAWPVLVALLLYAIARGLYEWCCGSVGNGREP